MYEELKSKMMENNLVEKQMVNEYIYSKPRLAVMIAGGFIFLCGAIVGGVYLFMYIVELIKK